MDNRSLEEFLDAGAGDGQTGAGEEPGTGGGSAETPGRDADAADGDAAGERDGTADRADPAPADAATSTYAVTTGPCAACDETVDRRWRDDPGLVCPDCKEW